ncbi:MAG: hypothetical protein PHQ88_07470 [Bacteroides sp.]|nr:hypothetical protein [Bacteroides sp.]
MSSQLRNAVIYADMARRYILFHQGEEWQDVKLWGLFNKAQVARQLKTGALKTYTYYARGPVWVYPTCETYLTKIKPIIDNNTLPEILEMVYGE